MLTLGRLGRDYAHPGVGPYPLIPEINTYDYGLVKVRQKLKWTFFPRGDLCWDCGGTLTKLAISLPRTYKKLHSEGGPYWFSS